MSARIGYPTAHLASTNRIENIDCPMFATGIGLVLKGFEKEELGQNDHEASNGDVRNHTDSRKQGSFFSKVLSKEHFKMIENFFMKDGEG